MEADEVVADSHRQVLGSFNKLYVHSGRISSYISQSAYNLFKKRNMLEYDPIELAGEDGSNHGIELATQAVSEVVEFFKSNGIEF